MLGRTDRRLRLVALLATFVFAAGAVTVRLAYWQVARSGDLRELARAQIDRSTAVAPARGDIVDRRGTVLATTAYRYLLSAFPDRIPDEKRPRVAERLVQILELEGNEADRIRDVIEGDDSYTVLARQITEEQSELIREGMERKELAGLSLTPRSVRFYPNPGGAPGTTLASQLLGFVTDDGEGRYGVEERFDSVLTGRHRDVAALSRFTAAVPDAGASPGGAPAGTGIRLTIDASLQLQVEKELYAAWVADKAQRVSSLVLDPHTGDVLAWASVPGYDANAFAQVARDASHLFSDPIASQVYEPGSVMKMFTATAALESGSVNARTPVNDVQTIRFGNGRVHNADRSAMGRITFEDVIAYSRNVATASVALRLGKDVSESAGILHRTWKRFGIGERTGIEVNGEVAGLVADPARRPWEPIDLANRAFGQGVAVTPVQLGVAFSTMANGGMHVPPRLVLAQGDEVMAQRPSTRVIDADLSAELRRLMTHVVTRVPIYAEGTLMPGYTVGGKTGTAQIWDHKRGTWAHNTYNFSFVGFVGHERPEAVIVTRIHEAKGAAYDLPVKPYELFRRIARDTVGALDVPPVKAAAATPSPRPPKDVPGAAAPPVEAPLPDAPGGDDPAATPPVDVPAEDVPGAVPPDDIPADETPTDDPPLHEPPATPRPEPPSADHAAREPGGGLTMGPPAPSTRSPSSGGTAVASPGRPRASSAPGP